VGVCDKRVKVNSVLCIGCKKWVHKRCSGVKGALKKVGARLNVNDVLVER
jgi:hypothetical protein